MAEPTPSDQRPSLAILDDYFSIAPPFFSSLPLSKIDAFPETLDASTKEGLAALESRLKPYTIISSMRERTAFPAALLQNLPNLKLLLNSSARNASIDTQAAASLGITVTGTTGKPPADGKGKDFQPPPPPTHDSTTQQALSLLLALTSRIPIDHALLTNPSTPAGAWQSGYSISLYGKTLGVIGLGKLGSNFARICVQALGLKVIAWSPNLTEEKAQEAAERQGLPKGSFTYVASKEELLRTADIVSLHLVLSDRTRGTLAAEDLALLKPTAILVNTARAGLVDEDALYDVLVKGKIKGAALDVFWKEPLEKESKWRTTAWAEDGRSLVVLSPHMGYVNEQTLKRWYEEQAEEVERFLKGEPPKLKMS